MKKIILESERGRFASQGAVQNRRLRREVTTISRMTHKNIVRYYQAWVEGGTETIEEALEINDEDADGESSESDIHGSSEGVWSESSTPSSSEGAIRNLAPRDDEDEESIFSSSSPSRRSEGDDTSGLDGTRIRKLNSTSMTNLLEQEPGYGWQSPLLTGFGFQSRSYEGMVNKRGAQHVDQSSDTLWDEDSSVKVGNAQGKVILYIQMEYCVRTLRKLIDDGEFSKMEENDIWRLVRQMLEGLVYIHR